MDANWTFHGPTNPLSGNFGLGRLTVVEFHPTDSNVYIIGTPGGGIWRTKDDGATWAPLNDFFPVLGVADIDYNPQNPNTIYVCTGDRDAGDTYSMGIFKSTDGGATWDTTGFQYPFTASKKTNGLIVNPIDTNSLTVATSDGIYKSYDAGKSWTLLYTGYFQQLLPHPTDTAIMFAAGSYQGAQNVFRSNDGGTSWQVVSGVNNGRRVEIAVTKANTAVVKVVVAKSDYGLEGIYNSTDTGKTFTKIFDDGTNCSTNILASSPKGDECAGQGWYDLSIEISPLDENQVVVGGVNTWVSTNGGSSWKLVNQWKNTVTGVTIVHADKHFHKFHPLQPSTLFECNDGGLFKTYAPMSTNSIWDNKSEGLGITQFYRNAVSDAATYVLGGAQDNGTKMLVGGTSQQMTGADGMECQMDPVDSNILYTAQQYGELRRSVDGGQKFTDIQGNIPGKPKGAWITPYIIHPVGRNVLVAGYNYVFVSTDYGDNWSAISPNFFNNITQLAATAIDDKYLFCATVTSSASTIRYTTDFGNAWKVLSPINSNMLTVSGLMVDPFCKDSLWVTYRTYTADKVAVADIRTGKWTVVDNGLPDVPVNCIEYDKSNNTLYIGTDLGVFYKEYNDTAWQYFNNGTLPNVEVMDLGINNTTNTIWAATYGRGMWSSPTHKSTTCIANTIPLAQDVVTIAPNPNYGDFNISTKNLALKGKSTAIRIMNMAGIVVWRNDVVLSKDGGAKIKVDLPRGTYLVEVLHEGTIFAKTKMVVF
ncbi:MAG: T9SS type A sorting domain-containing protein [Chitinophagaceae bacterium]|nr:T9SS type A sorting domain-containing protein [Chitinophagaceae bacterium]